MEGVSSDTESQHSPEQSSLVLSPDTERRINLWQQTGSLTYPELQMFPTLQVHEYSKEELRLVHHLVSITNDLSSRGTADLTVWVQKMPR